MKLRRMACFLLLLSGGGCRSNPKASTDKYRGGLVEPSNRKKHKQIEKREEGGSNFAHPPKIFVLPQLVVTAVDIPSVLNMAFSEKGLHHLRGSDLRRKQNDRPRSAKSCRHYLALVDKGYYDSASAADRATGAELLRTCRTLQVVSVAPDAKTTAVSEFDLGSMGLTHLPASASDLWRNEIDPDLERVPLRRELAGQIDEQRPDYLRVTIPADADSGIEEVTTSYEVVAFADINRDGSEDILVFASQGTGGGSNDFVYRLLVFSRDSSNEVLRTIAKYEQ